MKPKHKDFNSLSALESNFKKALNRYKCDPSMKRRKALLQAESLYEAAKYKKFGARFRMKFNFYMAGWAPAVYKSTIIISR